MFKLEDNPYTLQFSYIPPQYISRKSLMEEIVNDLNKKVPAFRCHFITGVRGSGKTVMMAEIANEMRRQTGWCVVDIENPEGNLIRDVARGLYNLKELKPLFVSANIDISLFGIDVALKQTKAMEPNEGDVLKEMLQVLSKNGKKVLVTIDEVTYCKEIAAFSHALSAYARADYNIFVVMTGLKENINLLKNNRSLTFLYRAKEHSLMPLNMSAVISDYEKVFGIDRTQAEQMGWETKGYSFAFQVLGYLYWEAMSKNENVALADLYVDYDQYLSEFVYDKIWSELPGMEKRVLGAIAQHGGGSVKEIREILSMNSNKFSVYRNRLIDRGLLNGGEYGKIFFSLPRFDKFVACQPPN